MTNKNFNDRYVVEADNNAGLIRAGRPRLRGA